MCLRGVSRARGSVSVRESQRESDLLMYVGFFWMLIHVMTFGFAYVACYHDYGSLVVDVTLCVYIHVLL